MNAPQDHRAFWYGPNRPTLSRRESEVLRYIVGGFVEKEIAYRMSVKRCTVSRYREIVRLKSGATTRRDLVLLARSLGLEPV